MRARHPHSQNAGHGRAGVVIALMLSGLSVVSSGCAANPLVGRWVSSDSTGGAEMTSTLSLNADGTTTTTLAGGGTCAGALTTSGQTWSTEAGMLVFTGTLACSGRITCTFSGTPVTIDCANVASRVPREGACAYTLAANNASLTVANCTGTMGGSTVYMRSAL